METSAIHIGPFLAEMDKGIRTSDAGENQMEQTQEKSDHQRRSCVVDETVPRNSWPNPCRDQKDSKGATGLSEDQDQHSSKTSWHAEPAYEGRRSGMMITKSIETRTKINKCTWTSDSELELAPFHLVIVLQDGSQLRASMVGPIYF